LIVEFVVEEETTLRETITRQKLRAQDGYLHIPDAPGLGIDLDESEVERLRVA
jgi:L-alanine-DL-glutamate epimerase-like enolase superfamily enzyme